MITSDLTANEIFKEVKKDIGHVEYALMKSYGGKRGYEADQKQMADQVLREPEGTLLLGNVETCTCRKTGNRWIVYSYAQNSGFNTANVGHREFVWMDTPDSIAAIQFYQPSSVIAWTPLIYSGHFFQRYAEREGLGPVDLQLVIDFMRNNNNGVIQFDEDPSAPGKHRFDVILRNGIGRGYTSGFDPDKPDQKFVSHVRTYLPTSMLSPQQREQTAESRAMQASKSRPADTFVCKMMADDEQGLLDYFTDLFLSRGLPAHEGRSFADLMRKIAMYEADVALKASGELTPSALRAVMLQIYHRNEQNVFDYVLSHPSKSGCYSMLDTLLAAKMTNPDLDTRAMITSMMEPDPDNKVLLNFIERTASQFDARFKEGIALGKIKI